MSKKISTEQKIKEKARQIFFKKGYSGTTTRDIVEAAGTNLALVNYYFGSKENLFNEIMNESFFLFFNQVREIASVTETTFEQKVEQSVEMYIDTMIKQPEIPIFILNELLARPDTFAAQIGEGQTIQDLVMFKQLVEIIGLEKVKKLNPAHIWLNMMGMTLYPFVSKSLLQANGKLTDEMFNKMMEERKKLIPKWIMQMLDY